VAPPPHRRPLPPEWWLVGLTDLDELPSHTVLRIAFRDHPTTEVLTPRAVCDKAYIERVAGLVLDPPAPPARPY
jgi:hypothetical protein